MAAPYGRGPWADEIELIVFGPGYGEAIALHLGDSRWLLVDSCVPSGSTRSMSLQYLEEIGAPQNAVKVIVASHWHDDHVRGIAQLVKAYPGAEFCISSVFSDIEAQAFLEAHGGSVAEALTRGTKELVASLQQAKAWYFVNQRHNLFEDTIQGRQVRVVALSPNTAAQAIALKHFATYVPTANAAVNHAPELKPNVEAIALHIDFEDDAMLLGSDLEEHTLCGWSAVTSNAWCAARRKASTYKVAHHGSISGHHASIWSELLLMSPHAVLTPFARGAKNLPSPDDRKRIKGLSGAAYITSGASRRPIIPPNQLRRMRAMAKNLAPVNAGFGAVRFRRAYGEQNWRTELFDRAEEL